jgi:hypothetical protein
MRAGFFSLAALGAMLPCLFGYKHNSRHAGSDDTGVEVLRKFDKADSGCGRHEQEACTGGDFLSLAGYVNFYFFYF